MDAKEVEKIKGQVLSILKGPTKGMVGIDIGLTSVKIAEVQKSGSKYTLTKFAIIDLPEGALIEDDIQKDEEVLDAIKQGLKRAGSSAGNASIGLFGSHTIARKLQLAGGSEEEIEDQVMWEVEQYLPFSIDDSSISFHIVGENEGGGVDVIIAAATSDIIENYKELVEKAGLKVKVIDLDILAITNVFEYIMSDKLGHDGSSYIIMDIGAQTTGFVIYKNGSIVFTKEMNIGGVMITEEIQRQMGINYAEAEDLKINGDGNGNLPEDVLEIIDDVIDSFFRELKKTIDFYINATSDEGLAECFLTGGGSLIPGMQEGLETLLGMKVSVLNPFDAYSVSIKKMSSELEHKIMHQGCTAIGLAMRELD